jgi:glycosyltransferase involved in cell wall biosynthesis
LLVEFAKHADRDRFDLRFVSLAGRGVLADELEAQGWPVETFEIGPGLHFRAPIQLAKLFRSWQTDIVHTHNERPLLYAAPAARLARVAAMIHTKHGRGTGNSRRQNWLTACAARLSDRFVCVSEDCARLALEQGVPSNRLTTLHNGIDIERFAFAGPQSDGPAMIVARLCLDKDIATLLRAVTIVVREAPEFRLQIAGDGPCALDLHRLTEKLALKNHVQFLGSVRDVPALLGRASMCVLSSLSEGVPLTLLEAMACGLPVIATRVGGVAEIVQDGVSGMLVDPSAPSKLASALLQVQRDFALARRLGLAGRRSVEERFDVRHMVEQYERLYRLHGHGSQSPPSDRQDFVRKEGRRDSPCESRI